MNVWIAIAAISIAINVYLVATLTMRRRKDHSEALVLIRDLVKEILPGGE